MSSGTRSFEAVLTEGYPSPESDPEGTRYPCLTFRVLSLLWVCGIESQSCLPGCVVSRASPASAGVWCRESVLPPRVCGVESRVLSRRTEPVSVEGFLGWAVRGDW